MRETLVSSVEREFVLQALAERKRLDGRSMFGRRDIHINFSSEWGSCQVTLGETRTMCKVSGEIMHPKSTRPNEGLLFINVELSPMAAVHFEVGRPSELCIEINRTLEKCIKESRCVDLESLCIVSDEKVWGIRVDITILNHEGNLVECASIAALAGLSHFKRPDITSTGDQIIIHKPSDRDPLPITLHHYPLCLSYAIFSKGKYIVTDPTYLEERVAGASLVVGMNGYRELCGLHMGGKAVSNHQSFIQCVQKAGDDAVGIIKLIRQSLITDAEERSKKVDLGFAASLRAGRITFLAHERIKVRLGTSNILEAVKNLVQNRKIKVRTDGSDSESEGSSSDDQMVVSLGDHSAELITKITKEDSDMNMEEEIHTKEKKAGMKSLKQSNKSEEAVEKKNDMMREQSKSPEVSIVDDEMPSLAETAADEIEFVAELTKEEKEKMKNIEEFVLDDSEEEETTTLTSAGIETPSSANSNPKKKKKKPKKKTKPATNRGWYPKEMSL